MAVEKFLQALASRTGIRRRDCSQVVKIHYELLDELAKKHGLHTADEMRGALGTTFKMVDEFQRGLEDE